MPPECRRDDGSRRRPVPVRFVRKEAVITSQIEGTQATLKDVLTFKATRKTDRPEDVQEVCKYVDALAFARREMRNPRRLPLTIRLLRETHKRLMRGTRRAEKLPGEIRTSQNWIGGTRPGNAVFVPPPPGDAPEVLSALERWIAFFSGMRNGGRGQRCFYCPTPIYFAEQGPSALLVTPGTTVPAVRLFDALPKQPIITLARVIKTLKTNSRQPQKRFPRCLMPRS